MKIYFIYRGHDDTRNRKAMPAQREVFKALPTRDDDLLRICCNSSDT